MFRKRAAYLTTSFMQFSKMGFQIVKAFLQTLNLDLCMPHNRHKICVTFPTRNNMKMNMFFNPCPAGTADIRTEIKRLVSECKIKLLEDGLHNILPPKLRGNIIKS